MKLTNRLASLLLLGLALVFSACKNDDGPVTPPNTNTNPPTIALTTFSGAGITGDTTVTAGSTLTFYVDAGISSLEGANLDKLYVESRQGTSGAYTPIDTINLDSNSFVVNQLAASVLAVEGTWQFHFWVKDLAGKTAELTVTVTVQPLTPVTPLLFQKSLAGGNGGTSCMSLRDSTIAVVQPANAMLASGNYDLYYFYSTTAGSDHNFVAPEYASDQDLFTFRVNGWSMGNATRFRATNLTSGQFNSATDANAFEGHYENAVDQTIAGWNTGATNGDAPAGTRINGSNVEAGDVIAFRTAGGKYGLIQVVSVGTAGTGQITVRVLVQP